MLYRRTVEAALLAFAIAACSRGSMGKAPHLDARSPVTETGTTLTEERELVMRAVAGRARGEGVVRLPAHWERHAPTDLLAATISARFRYEHQPMPTDGVEVIHGLGRRLIRRRLRAEHRAERHSRSLFRECRWQR